jgi:hypothetical protein
LAEGPLVGNVVEADHDHRHAGNAGLRAHRFEIVAEPREHKAIGGAKRHPNGERGSDSDSGDQRTHDGTQNDFVIILDSS